MSSDILKSKLEQSKHGYGSRDKPQRKSGRAGFVDARLEELRRRWENATGGNVPSGSSDSPGIRRSESMRLICRQIGRMGTVLQMMKFPFRYGIERRDTLAKSKGALKHRVRGCGEADAPQQVLETRIVPQIVHARIDMKIDKPVGVLFVGFLQVFNCAVVFPQADMDSSEEVRCDVLVLCEPREIIENL